MQEMPERFFDFDDFNPELQRLFAGGLPNPEGMLSVAIPAQPTGEQGEFAPYMLDKELIGITDGKNVWTWETDSLRALFRGDRKPPVLGDYPQAYNDSFAVIDHHLLELCTVLGDLRDAELKEIFSALRRRPDGRSLGFAHQYMWQVAALLLGTRPLSQAEFEAIMERMERSCRTFEIGPTSRNFTAILRRTASGLTGRSSE
jgi:hypothetical protein